MSPNNTKQEWDAYVAHETRRIQPMLEQIGFSLDELQPQTIGERYLTRPVSGGRKVVFLGRRRSDSMRVVIKTSSEANGVAELVLEQRARDMLRRIRFAYGVFSLPEELIFDETKGVLITEYIDQEKPFLDRPLKEQFTIALDSFKAQEGAHATTTEHAFEVADYYIEAEEYKKIGTYAQDIVSLLRDDAELYVKLNALLDDAVEIVRAQEETLDRYSGFLTHWDFIPQNFRIRNGKVYLLDLASVRFGNKYEGWARFINFMTLYNPPLADALVKYVRLNRTEEELLSLKLMRVYRLVELIRYYASWLSRTEGDTRELARARIAFWTEILDAVLTDRGISDQTIGAYKARRDSLRSNDEKHRQKDLH